MLGIAPQLLADLDAGCTVIVPTRQRAAAVRLSHAHAQLARARALWRTPDVMSWSAWLEREAVRASDGGERIPRLLRTAEEWWLWREATYEVAGELGIAAGEMLVDGVRNAAQLLFAWQIPLMSLTDAGGSESALLARALAYFESRCNELRAMGSHRLAQQVRGISSPRSLSFAGFLEHPPARLELMQAWGARSCIVRDRSGAFTASQTQVQTPIQVRGAATPEEELALAAHWCREQLLEDPQRHLLIVVPELEQRRQDVIRVFEQTLTPQVLLGEAGSAAHEEVCFAIEGGGSLSAYPLIRHALISLKFLTQSLEFEELSNWLRSAFWSEPQDAPRARLEAWLRGKSGIACDSTTFLQTLSQASPATTQAAVQLRASIQAAVHAIGEGGESHPRNRTLSHQWSRRFMQALTLLGWPGTRSLSSAEQQTKTRFLEALDEYSSLGPTLGAITAPEAVHTLRELIGRIAFQPSTGDPAVTVSGSLTDPIVHYDGIWVSGLHADVWPRPARFDPFIPVAAQQQAGVTAAHPRHQLAQARQLMQAWQGSGGQLVLSWPQRSEDCEHLMSPLLHDMRIEQVKEASDTRRISLAEVLRTKTEGAPLEAFEDGTGEAWPRGVELPAGTRSLEYQARCPFRAYAELRLNCTPLDQPRPGVDPRNRGWLLHSALERLWGQLTDSCGLQSAHREQRLDAMIDRCVEEALKDIFPALEASAPGSTSALARGMLGREHRRAAHLIRELCALELERPAFKVRALEQKCELKIGGAELTLRIDRVDELEGGELVIFDYKSGRPESPDWLGERLTHPQLLVYLLATGANVAALANVHLTPTGVTLRGIADRKNCLPRVEVMEDLWEAQIERWRQGIEKLAADFLAGHAVLDPAEHVCRNCHLHVFCRIAERG